MKVFPVVFVVITSLRILFFRVIDRFFCYLLFVVNADLAIYRELWRACAGPLVTVPRENELVFYFPQGHIEQVCYYFFAVLSNFIIFCNECCKLGFVICLLGSGIY